LLGESSDASNTFDIVTLSQPEKNIFKI